MSALLLNLTLLQPVIAGAVGGGDPNSIRSLEYIPGGLIRGVLISRLPNPIDAGNVTDRSSWFERVQFLHAYPLVEGVRLLPLPITFCQDALDPASLFADRACMHVDDPALKPVSGYCRLSLADNDPDEIKGNVLTQHVARHVAVHIQRPTAKTRGIERTVFRYEAIAADQAFQAVLLSDDVALLENLKTDLTADPMIKLGKSRGGGYGLVRIDEAKLVPGWQEATVNAANSDEIVVSALSDLLITDSQSGAWSCDPVHAFGVDASRRFVQTGMVGGFNRKWQLPVDQAHVIAAGSVFVFARTDATLARLRSLAATGVGERTVEGHGRIAIGWQGLETWASQPAIAARPANDALKLSEMDPARTVAERMSERMWRGVLDQQLVITVDALKLENRPKNAQLSRMRNLARATWRDGNKVPPNAAPNKQSLGQLEYELGMLRSAAKKQLLAARVSGKPLLDWLTELGANPADVWLKMNVSPAQRPAIGGVQCAVTQDIALEYAMRLIDGVMRQASKEGN